MTTEELMAEVERLRDTLKRIEALVWYEPEDYDDLVEGVRVMACERNEALSQIRGRQAEFAELHAEVERLRADLARCREVQRATAEGWRHEVAEVAAIVGAPAHTAELAACVRAEVERLMRERDEAKEHARLAKMIAARVQAERDELRAEVERLRTALAQAQRADE